MQKQKLKFIISGTLMLITLFCFYFRSKIPLDISSDEVENTIVSFGLFNWIFFLYLLYKTRIPKKLFWIIAVIITLHNTSWTLIHIRYYPDWDDLEIMSIDSNFKKIKQIQKVGFSHNDNYRVIEVYEIFPSIRIIDSNKELKHDSRR